MQPVTYSWGRARPARAARCAGPGQNGCVVNLSFLLTDLLTYLLNYVVKRYQCAIASHKMLRVCIALCVVYVSLSCLFVFVCTLHVCAYMYVACMHVFAYAWPSPKQVRSLVDPTTKTEALRAGWGLLVLHLHALRPFTCKYVMSLV